MKLHRRLSFIVTFFCAFILASMSTPAASERNIGTLTKITIDTAGSDHRVFITRHVSTVGAAVHCGDIVETKYCRVRITLDRGDVYDIEPNARVQFRCDGQGNNVVLNTLSFASTGQGASVAFNHLTAQEAAQQQSIESSESQFGESSGFLASGPGGFNSQPGFGAGGFGGNSGNNGNGTATSGNQPSGQVF